MRRTAAATAASLLAALVIGGPLASSGHAAGTSVACATATPPEACALLDVLAAQLAPIAPLLGEPLAPLASSAQALSARSDQPGGVPTAEVVSVSDSLLAELGSLPEPVEALVGAAGLGGLTDTLQALLDEVTGPAAAEQQSTGSSSATPAARSGSSFPVAASGGGSDATSSSAGSAGGSAPSGAAVPDVPVGDPLTLAPLALPDFGFDPSFEPPLGAVPTEELALADAIEELSSGQSRTTELAVVAVLSLLLLAGAGVAQLQANRHQIAD